MPKKMSKETKLKIRFALSRATRKKLLKIEKSRTTWKNDHPRTK